MFDQDTNQLDTPFSAEELASFAEVTPTQSAPPAPEATQPNYVTPQDLQTFHNQIRNDIHNDTHNLINQMPFQKPAQAAPPEPPKPIDIKVDATGKPIIDPNDLQGIISQAASAAVADYHQKTVAPYAQTMAEVQKQQTINTAKEFLRTELPDVMKNGNEDMLGRMAVELYSSAYNTGTDAQRTAYVVNTIKNFAGSGQGGANVLPISTGNSPNGLPAHNQIGRTQQGVGPQNPYGWDKGAEVKLVPKSINDVGGTDAYQEYAAYIQGVYDYNNQYKMGWKIQSE